MLLGGDFIDTTKNVYTISVTTICVVTYFVLYLRKNHKNVDYGNSFYIW